MMGDVSDKKVAIPKCMITLVSNREKSPDLLSHRGLEIFQPFAECPMRIHGKNIPTLDVPQMDLSCTPDNPMPPRIEDDDDNDSKRDIIIHEELLDSYSLSLLVIESFYFDIPSFSRPPAKPPDGNTGILNIKMMGDVSDQKVPMPRLTITLVPN
nr:hypothetical protein [Tanacetum cinerariifolium]